MGLNLWFSTFLHLSCKTIPTHPNLISKITHWEITFFHRPVDKSGKMKDAGPSAVCLTAHFAVLDVKWNRITHIFNPPGIETRQLRSIACQDNIKHKISSFPDPQCTAKCDAMYISNTTTAHCNLHKPRGLSVP